MQTFTWTIEQAADVYHARRNDGVTVTPIPHIRLEEALRPHGIGRDAYLDVRRQLDETGHAKIEVVIGEGLKQR